MEADGPKQSVYAEKFRIMLRLIPAPDGGDWSGTKMERASGGRVSTSYFSSLRDGHIAFPRADKLEAIAGAMGFQPGFWFKDLSWWRELEERWEDDGGRVLKEDPALAGEEHPGGPGQRLGELLDRLFEMRVDEETGEPLTNAVVGRKSGGVLTEEQVEALRAGRVSDPSWAQILALSEVFGVDPSYWSGRDAPSWRPSPAFMEGSEGRDAYVIFQNSLGLSEKERGMLKMLAEHLKREQERDRDS